MNRKTFEIILASVVISALIVFLAWKFAFGGSPLSIFIGEVNNIQAGDWGLNSYCTTCGGSQQITSNTPLYQTYLLTWSDNEQPLPLKVDNLGQYNFNYNFQVAPHQFMPSSNYFNNPIFNPNQEIQTTLAMQGEVAQASQVNLPGLKVGAMNGQPTPPYTTNYTATCKYSDYADNGNIAGQPAIPLPVIVCQVNAVIRVSTPPNPLYIGTYGDAGGSLVVTFLKPGVQCVSNDQCSNGQVCNTATNQCQTQMISVYQLENNSCVYMQILPSQQTSSQYSTLSECQQAMPSIPTPTPSPGNITCSISSQQGCSGPTPSAPNYPLFAGIALLVLAILTVLIIALKKR